MDQPDQNQPLTIKQQREQKRQSKLDDRASAQQRKTTQRWITWGVTVIGLGLIVWGLWYAAQPGSDGSSGQTTVGIQADDHVIGPTDASVVLIEYSDFQCPACKTYEPVVQQVIDQYGDKIAFVYRHFPLKSLHPNAEEAAWASEAAQAQGKFWEFHDLLFDRQSSWANEPDPLDAFTAYANELGLNGDTFQQDYDSSAAKDKVSRDTGRGNASRVQGTPTFFLNGEKISPASFEDFQKLIDAQLAS